MLLTTTGRIRPVDTPKGGLGAMPPEMALVDKNGTSCASTPPVDFVNDAALLQARARSARISAEKAAPARR